MINGRKKNFPLSIFNFPLQRAFTLIEILVVVTIIGLLITTAAVTYTQFIRQSRDSKRKADLENIRGALELYKSENNTYPTNLNSLTSSTLRLMNTVPKDPKDPSYSYRYQAEPAGCVLNCSDYILGALLEGGGSSCTTPPTAQCVTGTACNYCLNALGQQ